MPPLSPRPPRRRTRVPPLLLSLGVLHGAACAAAGQLRRADVAGPVGVPAAGRLPPGRVDAPFELPMAREWGFALVPVGVGGVDSLWFVLDLAAGGTVIAPATRDALGLGPAAGTSATVTGASGDARYQALDVDALRVGPYTRLKLGVTVVDLTPFQAPHGGPAPAGAPAGRPGATPQARAFAGILGNDVLRDFDVVLDFPRTRVRLYPRDAAGRSALRGLDALACTPNLARDPGWVVLDVLVDGAPVRTIVDTGARRSVFNWAAARQLGLTPTSPGMVRSGRPASGLGALAPTETYLYRFARMEAAGVRLRADTSRVADLPVFRALGLADRPALILGPHLLEDRAVAVSYSTGRVCFARTAAAAAR